MRPYQAIIYGAYGYTGKLIVRACKARGIDVLLSGRDDARLQHLSAETDYPFQSCHLNNLIPLLRKAQVVIHCAGPFQYTARQMVDACLAAGTHYLDITGEYAVFEMLSNYDKAAKENGILIMPGVGFDVVPSDCLSVHLKKKLPSATSLQLAFAISGGGASRGTALTMIEGLGYGSMIRKDGNLTPVALGAKVMRIDFGVFTSKALCIPWGDIATAWRSTGIPNIEVYFAVREGVIRMAMLGRPFNWLMRSEWLKRVLRRKVNSRPPGPDEEKLNHGKCYLWGRVEDADGNTAEARIVTRNGYALTAETTALIASKVLSDKVRPGYWTPAQYFGEALIFEVDGVKWM